MATKSRSETSARSKRLWDRLGQWYGSRLAEQYGSEPPKDWCEVVDAADNDTVTRVLSEIRNRHTTYPPTFPEFHALFAHAKHQRAEGPSAVDIIEQHLQRRNLTFKQGRELTYIGSAGQITGVVVPQDGDAPGFRLMLADLHGGADA